MEGRGNASYVLKQTPSSLSSCAVGVIVGGDLMCVRVLMFWRNISATYGRHAELTTKSEGIISAMECVSRLYSR